MLTFNAFSAEHNDVLKDSQKEFNIKVSCTQTHSKHNKVKATYKKEATTRADAETDKRKVSPQSQTSEQQACELALFSDFSL